MIDPLPVDLCVFDILFDNGVDMNTTLKIRQFPSFTLFVTLVRDGPFVGKPELFGAMLKRGYHVNEPRYMFESSSKVYMDFQTAAFIFFEPASIMYLHDNKAGPHFLGSIKGLIQDMLAKLRAVASGNVTES